MFEWALKAKVKAPEYGDLYAQYLDGGSKSLAHSRAFLWRVRHALHFAVGRKRDVLEHDLKPRIAAALGYEDQDQELAVECFMREYYLHARTVHHLVRTRLPAIDAQAAQQQPQHVHRARRPLQ